eukprot:9443217-Pyramimonas_sp.AAC.1
MPRPLQVGAAGERAALPASQNCLEACASGSHARSPWACPREQRLCRPRVRWPEQPCTAPRRRGLGAAPEAGGTLCEGRRSRQVWARTTAPSGCDCYSPRP